MGVVNARAVSVNVAAIRRERARRGWTQDELARHAGISAQTLSNLARTGQVSPAVLRKLAMAFTKERPVAGVDILLAEAAA